MQSYFSIHYKNKLQGVQQNKIFIKNYNMNNLTNEKKSKLLSSLPKVNVR